MNKQMLKRVVAFLLMAAVMVGLVFFRSENNYDKHYFRAKLARGQEVHCRIDLGKEGELKYLLQPNIYTFCKDQKPYIRRMLTSIMKGKKVAFYDDKSSVIIIDKNDGKGPIVARAHALCCGVVFTLFGIINTTTAMKEYNERIRG